MVSELLTCGTKPPRRPKPIDLFANDWTCQIVRQAVDGDWVPWASWVEAAFTLLPGHRARRDTTDALAMWRSVREQVLLSLDKLGLESTVVRTDEALPVALQDHYGDRAGLVHVHRNLDENYPYVPSIPSAVLLADSRASRHELAMLTTYRLVPAQGRIPLQLREFCGQTASYLSDRLAHVESWRDHLRVWSTLDGAPVLSAEPYNYTREPARLVADIREAVAANALPLAVDGPYPGVWSESAVLAFIHHDIDGPPLPAVYPGADTQLGAFGPLALGGPR
ncbi:hypothetical protein ACSMXN_20875 [Jatrophihabitans sp. DSM 45814]